MGASRTQDGADLRPDGSVDAQADPCQLRNPLRNDGNYRTMPMTARCAGATNPVALGTASVIPPTKTQAAVPDETLARSLMSGGVRSSHKAAVSTGALAPPGYGSRACMLE